MPETRADSLIVVTGLPRSGTSMCMQMLQAGGVGILTDGLRESDEDNPRGYLEFTPVKSLRKDSEWLRGAPGKAVKIVAPLLPALPPDLPCKVIFMERELNEVLDSQDRMLQRRKQAFNAGPYARASLREEYARIVSHTQELLACRADTELLTLRFVDALTDPQAVAAKINTFLGGSLDTAAMAASVDPSLYRNRAE